MWSAHDTLHTKHPLSASIRLYSSDSSSICIAWMARAFFCFACSGVRRWAVRASALHLQAPREVCDKLHDISPRPGSMAVVHLDLDSHPRRLLAQEELARARATERAQPHATRFIPCRGNVLWAPVGTNQGFITCEWSWLWDVLIVARWNHWRGACVVVRRCETLGVGPNSDAGVRSPCNL